MWRPCVWPPAATINTPNCTGGKMQVLAHAVREFPAVRTEPMHAPCCSVLRVTGDTPQHLAARAALLRPALTVGEIVQAYVYHMYKVKPCGDDYYYENDMWSRNYTSPKTKVIPASYFQPDTETWYTIWSHVKMNTAGARYVGLS
jgi:hypothetical protein